MIYPLLTPELNPTASVLANDIDIRVVGPGNQIHYPWSLNPAPGQRGNAATRNFDNAVDNVEQVQIDSPGSNVDHTVQITHKNPLANGLQRVSLIISGAVVQPQELRIASIAQTGASQMTLLFPSVVGQSYQVQYIDTVTASTWTNAGSEVAAVNVNTAVNVAYSSSNPQRFYRVITVD